MKRPKSSEHISPPMILAGVMLVMCVAATALSPRAASGQDPFKALELIKPARTGPADDFTVASPDGKQLRLGDHRGQVIFLNFWATWCRPCVEEIPAIEWLYQRYRDKGFTVIAISVDSDIGPVPPFIKQHRATFSIGHDPRMAVADRYDVRALPSSYLIDRRGNLVALAIGPRAWDTKPAYAVIEALLNSQ
jgi:cytochrome c biogenesis protein CcmG, thiol:disulfide interchange protein DsbE